jgi:hypothetical protein
VTTQPAGGRLERQCLVAAGRRPVVAVHTVVSPGPGFYTPTRRFHWQDWGTLLKSVTRLRRRPGSLYIIIEYE